MGVLSDLAHERLTIAVGHPVTPLDAIAARNNRVELRLQLFRRGWPSGGRPSGSRPSSSWPRGDWPSGSWPSGGWPRGGRPSAGRPSGYRHSSSFCDRPYERPYLLTLFTERAVCISVTRTIYVTQ